MSFATIATSLLSAVIVAVLGHWLGTRRRRSEEISEFKLKAYTDFLNAVSRLTYARRIGIMEDKLEDIALANDAKTRICICAEEDVVVPLMEFWEYGGTLEREDEILAFKRLCLAIRKSMGHRTRSEQLLRISDTLYRLQLAKHPYIKCDI